MSDPLFVAARRQLFSLIASKMLDPIFAPIEFEFDMPGRRAKVSISGVLETRSAGPTGQ
jgi:hypothetical protein